MSKKILFLTVFSFFLCTILTVYISKEEAIAKSNNPSINYRVYLNGKSIGLIKSKENLEKYISEKQQQIKNKYKVKDVYAPMGLSIEKEITYNEKISSIKDIYKKIEKDNNFTIEGYKIVIGGIDTVTEEGTKKEDDKVIYVLDKEIFTNSVKNTMFAFVDEEKYEKFISKKQEKITDYGQLVEDIYVQNNIKVTKENIPANEKIFLDESELSKYILFGTTDDQTKYTIQLGDTIEDVAFNNKISNEEFLIANPEFTSANDLLFPGQQVTLGAINPVISVIEEDHVVEKQYVAVGTKYEYDDTKYTDFEEVKQEGQQGENVVTQKIKYINGEPKEYIPIETEVLVESVDKIIVKGTKQYSSGGGITNIDVYETINPTWRWPVTTPYGANISSDFGWRGHKLHEAVDIGGQLGSPIYAANNGAVVASEQIWPNGNYVLIKHSNNYYTIYAHLSKRYVAVGAQVKAGQVIGLMGKTGLATGVHLHFGVYNGRPYASGTRVLSPWSLF
ncbi:MAG: M23 family metallopeptidase [Bacilli bacterium]|nr:M23 family metallopeptidase [Bacilli bacterium]